MPRIRRNTFHIDKFGPDFWLVEPKLGCWLWKGTINKYGYGVMSVNGHATQAHRFVYERFKKKIDVGKQLDHFKAKEGCPRRCVNPDHMEEVSNAENVRRGERALLTKEQVIQIRKDHLTSKVFRKVIGAQYGVDRKTIDDILNFKTWVGV